MRTQAQRNSSFVKFVQHLEFNFELIYCLPPPPTQVQTWCFFFFLFIFYSLNHPLWQACYVLGTLLGIKVYMLGCRLQNAPLMVSQTIQTFIIL